MAMRLRIYASVLLLALLCQSDNRATESAPSRIISLAPSVTEVLFEIGLGPRVVGVTSYCRYPRAVLALPKIGGYLTPSYEAVVALRPDLAVVLPEHADIEPQLRRLNMPILRVDHRSIEGVIQSLTALGELCGTEARAREAVHDLRLHLARARQIASTTPRPRVLVCFGRSEDFRRLYAAAPGTIHHDLVTLAGGRNVLTSPSVSYPTLSAEGLMRLNPDVIVEFGSGRADRAVLRRQWNVLDSLQAVRAGRVYVFTEDFLSVPGPRFVRFTETLARVLNTSNPSGATP
jgi:iron complex transport system substrate-binding protein